MKHASRLIIPVATLLFSIYSCVDDIDSKQFNNKYVVVNCILNRDTIQHLSLTYSNELGNTTYDEVEDATVMMYENDSLIGGFKKSGYAEWELDYQPVYGQHYRVEITIAGRNEVYAETQFPSGLRVLRNTEKDSCGYYVFDVTSYKPYWVFSFDKGHDTIMQPPVIEDRFNLVSALGTDNPSADDFNKLNYDDCDAGKHYKYIRMNPSLNEQSYKLYDLYSCLIVFRNVSDSYDKYLKSSLSKMIIYETFDDPTQWLDETVVFNNIHNGLGIFGAYYDIIINCNNSEAN